MPIACGFVCLSGFQTNSFFPFECHPYSNEYVSLNIYKPVLPAFAVVNGNNYDIVDRTFLNFIVQIKES
jgi:hypothetical protein